MTYLMIEIVWSLLIAAAIGFVLGLVLWGWFAGESAETKAKLAEFQRVADGRLADVERLKATHAQSEATWKAQLAAAERANTDAKTELQKFQGLLAGTTQEWQERLGAVERARVAAEKAIGEARSGREAADRQAAEARAEAQRLASLLAGQKLDLETKLKAADSAREEAQRAAEAGLERLQAAFAERKGEWEARILAAEASADQLRGELLRLKPLAAKAEALAAAEAEVARLRDMANRLEEDLDACRTARESLAAELSASRTRTPAAPPAAPPPHPAAPADDLKDIVGIGPVLERELNGRGIRTFADLAALTAERIDELGAQIPNLFGDRIRRERWVEQAAELHRRKHGAEA